MQEEYLHYLFKQKFFPNQLKTVKGEVIEILDRGQHNHNAGPDFLEGKVKYDGKTWAGHIEFHVKSSDWYLHKHQTDVNYNNVIAHIVYEYDKPVFINDYEIPTIVISHLIDEAHYNHYLEFKNAKSWIPCASQIQTVDDFYIFQQKEKALINRLIRKSAIILHDVSRFKGNQHQAFWIALGKVFGGKVNGDVFASLIEKIEAHHLSTLNYEPTDIEAYCFGLSGFLDETIVADNYIDDLKTRFNYQRKLFDLSPLPASRWKFSRMRPGNFPTIRLAQFASLVSKTAFDYRAFETKKLKETDINLSDYWRKHYHFGKISKRENAGLTDGFKSLIAINAYLPFLFAQGTIVSHTELKEQAINALLNIKAEQNSIIKEWKQLGVKVPNAFDSQALIEQKNEFCGKTKCLQCHIGLALLKQ